MMSYLFAASVFWILSILLVRRWLPLRFAVPILFIKFSIPVLYRFAAGQYVPQYNAIAGDSFYDQTNSILDEGHTPFSLLLEGFGPIESMMNTTDPFYWWWTSLWITTIENTVHSTILANAFVTVIASVIVVTLIERFGYSYKYQQLFLVFTLIHWEILTWSSILNIKDPLVAMLTVLGIYLMIVALQTTDTRVLFGCIISLSISLWLLTLIRWYIPGLFLAALCIWLVVDLLSFEDISPTSLLGTSLFGAGVFWFLISNVNLGDFISLTHVPVGFYRYVLGPTPGGTADVYTFLNLSAPFHWLFAPVALLGIIILLTERFERLILIYGFLLVCIYAGTQEAAGPRFRFQFVFFSSFLQFHGLWFLIQRRYQIEIRTLHDEQYEQ